MSGNVRSTMPMHSSSHVFNVDLSSSGPGHGRIQDWFEILQDNYFPLDVKVVLLGERQLYYTLSQMYPDFAELFKVAADFEDQMDRTRENHLLYARMIATMVHREGLRPFNRDAVARVIEQSARLAGDAERLSFVIRDDYFRRDR